VHRSEFFSPRLAVQGKACTGSSGEFINIVVAPMRSRATVGPVKSSPFRHLWSASLIAAAILTAAGSPVYSQDPDLERDIQQLDQLIEKAEREDGPVRIDDQLFDREWMVQYRDTLRESGHPGPRSGWDRGTRRWPGGVVPYKFSGAISDAQRRLFESACRRWEQTADVRFVPLTDQENYIYVFDGDGNYSFVGMRGGEQDLSISNWDKFIICHELGHALGLVHEHQRSDRNQYVRIYWKDIEDSREHNFVRIEDSVNRSAYDFESVMHYSRYAFSNSRYETILPLPQYLGYQYLMGQREYLSRLDQSGMEKAYHFGAPVIQTRSLEANLNSVVFEPLQVKGVYGSVNITGVPPGLTFDQSAGAFTGVPTQQGIFTVQVQVINGAGKDSAQFPYRIWPPLDLSQAVDQDGTGWASLGDIPWKPQRSVTHDNDDAALVNTGFGTAILSRTIDGPGSLFFWANFTSGSPQDGMFVNIDDAPVLTVTAGGGWQMYEVELPAGSHKVAFVVTRGVAGTSAILDEVLFLPPNQLPNAPTNVSPGSGATNVDLYPTLTASAFSDPDAIDTHAASQWLVVRQDNGNPVFDSGAVSNHKTSIMIGELELSTGYGWSVRYMDSRGDWSPYSTVTYFTTAASYTPPPPPAPEELTGRAPGSRRVSLTWIDDSPLEQQFEIQRRTQRANHQFTNWAQVALVNENQTTADIGGKPDTVYEFRVRAINSTGPSDFSNVVRVKTR
jgi:hypothetical protein